LKIEISGHTDNVGTYDYNKTLSENRALSVLNYLTENGIETSRLKYAGYADTRPVATNDTEEGRALNRRTEFKVWETTDLIEFTLI
jgi:outer membrane protein OmpA-like peptidoglycan-associated protein